MSVIPRPIEIKKAQKAVSKATALAGITGDDMMEYKEIISEMKFVGDLPPNDKKAELVMLATVAYLRVSIGGPIHKTELLNTCWLILKGDATAATKFNKWAAEYL